MDDHSSIHQQIRQDTDMNADDQLGFVIVLSETSALGVTIESGQFLHVTYEKLGKPSSSVLAV